MNDDSNGAIKPCPLADWDKHLADVEAWAKSSMAISDLVKDMHRDTTHLSTLPEIAKELRAMRMSLVGPATSRAFIPIGPALAIIAFMTAALMIIATIKITSIMPNVSAIETTASGVRIQAHP